MSWRFWKRRRASGLTEEQRAALKSLVADARYELIPLSNALDRAAALPRGSQVTVTASPSHGIEAIILATSFLPATPCSPTITLSAASHMLNGFASLFFQAFQSAFSLAESFFIKAALLILGFGLAAGEGDGVASCATQNAANTRTNSAARGRCLFIRGSPRG